MIGFVRGIVELQDNPILLINVNGVGYKVLVSPQVLQRNLEGQDVTLHTYTHVREEALELYGFLERADLKLFEQLIGVSGVGPKTALGIFAVGNSDAIERAIVAGDVNFFTAVPRLGKKNAQKVIIELKNKLGSKAELDLSEKDTKENEDVIQALKSFGFTTKEAIDAIKHLPKDLQPEEKIRNALKYLAK